jgi:hypothetical protein
VLLENLWELASKPTEKLSKNPSEEPQITSGVPSEIWRERHQYGIQAEGPSQELGNHKKNRSISFIESLCEMCIDTV